MMKRGLSSLDPRLSGSDFTDRQERLRQLVRDRGLDALLVYGDASCGGDIAYLTHATLYWADAVLVLPAEGPSMLAKTLGPRTDTWFRATSFIGELCSGPRLPGLLARELGARGYRELGLVDYRQFPASVVDELRATGHTLHDLGPVVAQRRGTPDEAGLADLAACARLGQAGLAAARDCLAEGRPDRLRAEAEFAIRAGGAWDAVVQATPTPSGALVVQVRCQLRDAWYGALRTLDPAGGPVAEPAFARLVDALRPGGTDQELVGLLPPADPECEYELTVHGAPEIEWRPATGVQAGWRGVEGGTAHLALRAWTRAGALAAAHGDTYRITTTGARPLADTPAGNDSNDSNDSNRNGTDRSGTDRGAVL
jgi:hypothetical protein